MEFCVWDEHLEAVIATSTCDELLDDIIRVEPKCGRIDTNQVYDITHNFILTTDEGSATLLLPETVRALCRDCNEDGEFVTVQFQGTLKESAKTVINTSADFDAFWESVKDDFEYDEDVPLICDIEKDREKLKKRST